jgi:hypothetical protein
MDSFEEKVRLHALSRKRSTVKTQVGFGIKLVPPSEAADNRLTSFTQAASIPVIVFETSAFEKRKDCFAAATTKLRDI